MSLFDSNLAFSCVTQTPLLSFSDQIHPLRGITSNDMPQSLYESEQGRRTKVNLLLISTPTNTAKKPFPNFCSFQHDTRPCAFLSPRHRWTEAMCEAHVTSPGPSSLDVTSLNGSRKPRPPESFASIASKLERHVFYVPIWRQAVSQRDAFQRRELWWCSVEIDHSLASPEDYCAPAPPGRVKHNRISSNNHHLFSRLRHCIAQH